MDTKEVGEFTSWMSRYEAGNGPPQAGDAAARSPVSELPNPLGKFDGVAPRGHGMTPFPPVEKGAVEKGLANASFGPRTEMNIGAGYDFSTPFFHWLNHRQPSNGDHPFWAPSASNQSPDITATKIVSKTEGFHETAKNDAATRVSFINDSIGLVAWPDSNRATRLPETPIIERCASVNQNSACSPVIVLILALAALVEAIVIALLLHR